MFSINRLPMAKMFLEVTHRRRYLSSQISVLLNAVLLSRECNVQSNQTFEGTSSAKHHYSKCVPVVHTEAFSAYFLFLPKSALKRSAN